MSTSNSLLTTVFRHVRHLESSIDSLSLLHCAIALLVLLLLLMPCEL